MEDKKTPYGKVVVIKSLLFSKITHIVLSLPNSLKIEQLKRLIGTSAKWKEIPNNFELSGLFKFGMVYIVRVCEITFNKGSKELMSERVSLIQAMFLKLLLFTLTVYNYRSQYVQYGIHQTMTECPYLNNNLKRNTTTKKTFLNMALPVPK